MTNERVGRCMIRGEVKEEIGRTFTEGIIVNL